MEFQSDSVTADINNNRVAVCLCVGIDRICNISQMSPWFCRCKTKLYTFFCNTHQTFGSVGYFADHEHTGCIREIAVQNGRYIDVDDITLLQDDVFIRDSVAHFIIDRGAYTFREALIIQRSRDSTVCSCKIIYDLVNLSSTHACANVCGNFIQNSRVESRTFFDLFDLRRSLQKLSGRYNFPSVSVQFYFFFDRHMAFFIFFAAPARIISFHV